MVNLNIPINLNYNNHQLEITNEIYKSFNEDEKCLSVYKCLKCNKLILIDYYKKYYYKDGSDFWVMHDNTLSCEELIIKSIIE
jgi:hypothetical protein